MMHFTYPALAGKSEAEKLRQLEKWLRTLVDQLNYLAAQLSREET